MIPSTPTTPRTRGDIARAIGNLAWTSAIVIGAPLLLARTFGYPLPHQIPDWGAVIDTPMQLVEPAVFINALVCIGWIVWAVVAAYVAIDLIDLARGVGHRGRRIGPASLVAGKLVTSIALLIALLRPQPAAGPLTRPAATHQIINAPQPTSDLNTILIRADPPPPRPSAASPSAALTTPTSPTYVVQRGDSLWRIADEQLGSGFRWKEIHQLNRDLITNPDLICVGWTLALPADAMRPASVEDHASPASDPPADAPEATVTPPVPAPGNPTDLPPAPDHETPATTTNPSHTAEQPSLDPAPTPTSAPTTEPANIAPTTITVPPLSQRTDDTAAASHEGGPAMSSSDEPPAAVVAGAAAKLAVPTLLAATVIGAVERRRRHVLQHRPLRAALPPRDPALRPIEARLRAEPLTNPTKQIAWVDVVLRLLTRANLERTIAAQLILVRVGTYGVELLWDRPVTHETPDGFIAHTDGQSWEYPCGEDDDLATLEAQLLHIEPHTHALVSLGDTADGPVLINLHTVDQIDLAGDPDTCQQWLAGTILELDTHPWAQPVDVAISPPNTNPTRLTTSLHLDDDGTAHPLVWRSDRTQPPAPWQLTITPAAATLHSTATDLTIEVSPVGVDDDTFTATRALLEDAARDPYRDQPDPESSTPATETPPNAPTTQPLPASEPPSEPPPSRLRISANSTATNSAAQPETASTGTLLAEPPSTDDPTDFTTGALLVVRVLGPVHTSGWHQAPKSPRTEDIVVYLALARPDRVSREQLIDALWNGKDVSTKLLYNYIGTLRRELGDAAALTSAHGSYQLRDDIRTDWDHFNHTVESATGQDWPRRRAALGHALGLVYGRPFDTTDRYQWAHSEGTASRIEVAITDTAAELATEALAHNDHAMTIWAARQGLLACPWHVRLYGYILDAHAAAGNSTALEHTWRELQRAAGRDGIPDDLIDTYRRAGA